MQENHILDIDREAESFGYATAQPNDFDLQIAKESLIPTFQSNIEKLIEAVENGEMNPLDVYAPFKKIEKMFKEAYGKIETHAMDEASKNEKTFVYSGVTFTSKEGSKKLQFGEDHVIKELQEKIKNRQELLKVAHASKEPIFDSEGIEVPKVSVKFDKSSLMVQFPK